MNEFLIHTHRDNAIKLKFSVVSKEYAAGLQTGHAGLGREMT